MQIVDGKKIANAILNRLKKDSARFKQKPSLAVVLVGEDKASSAYVRRKQEASEAVGIKFRLFKYPANISQIKLITELQKIQSAKLAGIIIQLPLPKGFDKKTILNQIKPEMDVDFLTWVSLGKLVIGETHLIPPAAAAILEILKYHKVNLTGKHVVLVGQGDLIGKPLTNILVKMPVTLTVCNKETKNLSAITKQADILITGVGKANLIRGDMVKKGVVAIDAGVSFEEGKMHGDLKFDEVSAKASLITPTPGGVGPITVAKLLENTIANAK